MKIGELTLMVCTECGDHFLVADPNIVMQCGGKCRVISGSKGVFVPFNEYIKESVKWY